MQNYRKNNQLYFKHFSEAMESKTLTENKRKRLLVSLFCVHFSINNIIKAERRLWQVSLTMLLVWFVSWTPYVMVFLLATTGYKELVTHHMDMIPGQWN